MTQSSAARWRRAQAYEQQWWGAYAGDYGWYRDFSREIEEAVRPLRPIRRDTAILEIGPGPAGGITYLDADRKFAVEPLEACFAAKPEIVALRDPRVRYFEGRGEDLPFEPNSFDLVIIDNVLDHCEDPGRVLDEMNRVLRPGGLVFLRQNVYRRWGRLVRKVMETAQVDRGHPHTFGRRGLEREFGNRGWLVRTIACARRPWLAGLTSGSRKQVAKSLLFANADRVTWVLEKGTAGAGDAHMGRNP
jgi:SAM-dependent methyltransferase